MRQDSKVTFSPGNYDTTTTPEAEWRVVTDPEEGKRVSVGKRVVQALAELKTDPTVQEAGLLDEEILALLLYTGWSLTGSFSICGLLLTTSAQQKPDRRAEALQQVQCGCSDVLWPRSGLPVHFCEHAHCSTGPMFCKYNAVLRGFPKAVFDNLKGNKYATTIHLIVSGVIKLSRCVIPSVTPLLHGARVLEC